MPEATAAPPAAPAPAPAASTPTAPAAAPAQTSAPATPSPGAHSPLQTSPQMLDAFSDLEKLTAEPETTAKPPETPEEEGESGESETESEPTETPPAIPQKGQQSQKPTSKLVRLRQAYEQARMKLAQMEVELKAVKSAKPPEDPEKKTLSERLAEREKRVQELEDRIRYSNFEQSDEYMQKYHQPFVEAYQAGRNKASSLTVEGEDGNIRQGKAEDFDAIMQTADDNAATAKAYELFQNKASAVLYWRERVLELNSTRNKALEDYRKNGAARHKEQMERHTVAQQKAAQMFSELNKQAAEKFPKLFKPVDGDEEGNKLLENGYRKVDMAFNGGKGVDENGKEVQLSPEAIVALDSVVRNKAAAFDRQVLLNRRLSAKVAELEKSLASFKASEPGTGDGGKIKEKPKYDSAMAEAEAGLDKWLGK